MNIDMAALHAIEIDRGISVDELLETIKSALLTAYRHTDGHQPDARIEIVREALVVWSLRQARRRARRSVRRTSRAHYCPGPSSFRSPTASRASWSYRWNLALIWCCAVSMKRCAASGWVRSSTAKRVSVIAKSR